MARSQASRARLLGAYPTPHWLVDKVVAATLAEQTLTPTVRVFDPACGDGRFLAAVARTVQAAGRRPVLTGVEIDPSAADGARRALAPWASDVIVGNALTLDLAPCSFDVVVGNPPFLSPLTGTTSRIAKRSLGAGPYADVAAEFLALSVHLAAAGGRVGLVLPQSVLASRHAGPVRAGIERVATRRWTWWSAGRHFDADVVVCALVFAMHTGGATDRAAPPAAVVADHARKPGDPVWTGTVTSSSGVPPLDIADRLQTDGTIGERAVGHAAFRNRFYALAGAVVEGGPGPRLITSGLVDPLVCHWGRRPATFGGRRLLTPVVDLARLDDEMQRWSAARLVPKVVVANQTRIVEAAVDSDGSWVPSVPTVTLTPRSATTVDHLAAVLTSAVASVLAWHQAAGTGRSATTIRLGPRLVESIPWPAGSLTTAARAVADRDPLACGRAVHEAYGLDVDDEALSWWAAHLARLATRA